MRKSILLVLGLVLLGGCVNIVGSEREDFPDPANAAEKERRDRAFARAGAILVRIVNLNEDLCPKQGAIAAYCNSKTLGVGVNNAIGALAGRRGDTGQFEIWTTTGQVESAQKDGELAITLGHEFAHILLGHNTPSARGLDVLEKERQADCVGTILAARAGYNPEAGPEMWRRMAATPHGVMNFLTQTEHLKYTDRIRITGDAGEAAKAILRQGRVISREDIRRICGVAP